MTCLKFQKLCLITFEFLYIYNGVYLKNVAPSNLPLMLVAERNTYILDAKRHVCYLADMKSNRIQHTGARNAMLQSSACAIWRLAASPPPHPCEYVTFDGFCVFLCVCAWLLKRVHRTISVWLCLLMCLLATTVLCYMFIYPCYFFLYLCAM